MTRFISRLHNDLRLTRLSKRGATHAESDVPQGLHKSYPRMKQIALPEPETLTMSVQEAQSARRSTHMFGSDTSLSVQECGTLFGSALRKHDTSNSRHYPSGGGLYPIETYVIGVAIAGSAPAVFHYNPTTHSLEKMWDLPEGYDIKKLAQKPDNLIFPAIIVYTAVWKRSSAKYGDFTYTLALLEAGHMSENIVLTAAAMNLQARPMAGFNDRTIIDLLDLDEQEEQPVHTVILGK